MNGDVANASEYARERVRDDATWNGWRLATIIIGGAIWVSSLGLLLPLLSQLTDTNR